MKITATLCMTSVFALFGCAAPAVSTSSSAAPSLAASHAPIGTIIAWPGQVENGDPVPGATKSIIPNGTIPKGWALCNGQWIDYATTKKNRALHDDVLAGIYGLQRNAATGKVVAYRLPDYRGRFLRGVSHSSGVDEQAEMRTQHAPTSEGFSPIIVGSLQEDTFEGHYHQETTRPIADRGSSGGLDGGSWKFVKNSSASSKTSISGGLETRPVNTYTNWIIRVN